MELTTKPRIRDTKNMGRRPRGFVKQVFVQFSDRELQVTEGIRQRYGLADRSSAIRFAVLEYARLNGIEGVVVDDESKEEG